MFVEALSGSSGGNVKSGTTASTAQNTDIVIDTGLSTVSKFVWWAKRNGFNNIQIVNVDNSIFQDKYNSNLLGTSASSVNVAFGTATQNTVMVKSISGGVVTLHTYNSAMGNVDGGVWFAE